MANEAVGIKTGLSIKKETVVEGKVLKVQMFFPDLGVSVEVPVGTTNEEALKLAKKINK